MRDIACSKAQIIAEWNNGHSTATTGLVLLVSSILRLIVLLLVLVDVRFLCRCCCMYKEMHLLRRSNDCFDDDFRTKRVYVR